MASFRAHFSAGIVLGVAAIAAALSFALGDEPGLLASLFVMAVVGALAPDMDSDSGVPFHVTFGSLSLVAGSVALAYALDAYPEDWTMIVGVPLGTAACVWIVVGFLFKQFTHHRGMAHSIPAMFIAALAGFYGAGKFGFAEWEAFLLGVATGAGYLVHLVLDELYAAVNWGGMPFMAKQSLGSALKFLSRDTAANLMTYGLLVFMAWGNSDRLWTLSTRFFHIIEKAL